MDEELSPEDYRELINHTVDILTIFDDSGIIRWESPSARRVVGYEPDGLIGENVFEYIHPDDRERAVKKFQEAVATSDNTEIKDFEFRFQHEDGSWVWLEARGETKKATSLDGYVITTRDISDRKEYEQDLKAERDRLDRFTSIVSHDLRNPLNVATSRLSMAQADCESEHLEDVADAHDRMAALIEDLLALAQHGGEVHEMEWLGLNPLVNSCWHAGETNGGDLRIDEDAEVLADQSRLRQLFENLLANAIEHGGPNVTVSIGMLSDGFYIADDGPGIPEADREKVLERGYSTSDDGTGYGLSIVKEIASAHGWDVAVTESRDGGARFEFTGVELR